jgi:hypothetical protein
VARVLPDACDRTRFDLAHWQTFETWTRTLRDEGIFAELWFFADNSGWAGSPSRTGSG